MRIRKKPTHKSPGQVYENAYNDGWNDAIDRLLSRLPTEEEIDQAIHDICVLEERLTRHYKAAQQPLDEIRKLQKRQRQAITNLLKGER